MGTNQIQSIPGMGWDRCNADWIPSVGNIGLEESFVLNFVPVSVGRFDHHQGFSFLRGTTTTMPAPGVSETVDTDEKPETMDLNLLLDLPQSCQR